MGHPGCLSTEARTPPTRPGRWLLAGVTALALAATPLVTAGPADAAAPAIAAPVVAAPARAAAPVTHPETGLYGSSDPTYDGVLRQSLAILGLHAAGRTASPEAAAWLLRQQCANGGFSSYNPKPSKPCPAYDTSAYTGGQDTNATAVAVPALLVLGRTHAAQRAASWLKKVQNPDGGWPFVADLALLGASSDPNSTGLVMTALSAAGITAKDSPASAVDYLAGLQVGRADLDSTPAADRGGIATPWQPTTPNLFATLQAVPGLAGADLRTVPAGTVWQDDVAAAPSSVPAATAAGVSHWATSWLRTQVDDEAMTVNNASWAILALGWDRRGETTAYDLYADKLTGKVPATDPGGNGLAALAAAVLGHRTDLARYAENIAATLQRDTLAPTVAVVVPKGPKKVSSWKRLRVKASDSGSGVANVKVAVDQKRSGTWYAFNGRSWKRAANGHAKRWLTADAARNGSRWRLTLPGLTTGRLVVRAKAADAMGNRSAAVKVAQRLTKRK